MPETWTPTVGDPVVTWRGDDDATPSPQMTITRTTATQLVTSDGRRWKTATLRPVGDHGYMTPRLYRADDPRIAASTARREAKAERARVARDLADAAGWWVNHHTDDEMVDALRAAVVAAAPHLGLTVTDPATLCQYGLDGNHDDRCLLPADHVDSGRWHAGLGWTASLGPTSKED